MTHRNVSLVLGDPCVPPRPLPSHLVQLVGPYWHSMPDIPLSNTGRGRAGLGERARCMGRCLHGPFAVECLCGRSDRLSGWHG